MIWLCSDWFSVVKVHLSVVSTALEVYFGFLKLARWPFDLIHSNAMEKQNIVHGRGLFNMIKTKQQIC